MAILVHCWILIFCLQFHKSTLTQAQSACQLDLVVLYDISVCSTANFTEELQTVSQVLVEKPISPELTHVAIISYNSESNLELPFTGDLLPVASVIQSLQQTNDPAANVVAGLNSAISLFQQSSRAEAKRVILMITNGKSVNRFNDLLTVILRATQENVTIFAATEQEDASLFEMQLYTKSAQRVFQKNSVGLSMALNLFATQCMFSELFMPKISQGKLAANVGIPLQKVENFDQSSASNGETEDLDNLWKFRDPDYSPFVVKQGSKKFTPENVEYATVFEDAPGGGGYQKSDVIYMLDTSKSVAMEFQKPIQLLQAFSNSLNIAPDGDRVAMIVYSGWQRRVDFNLNDKNNTQQVLQAIQAVQPYGGATQTAAALQLAMDQVLPQRRPGVPLKILLVTDGIDSQDDAVAVAQNLRSQGAQFIAGAVTPYNNIQSLTQMVGSGQNVIAGQDANVVSKLVQQQFAGPNAPPTPPNAAPTPPTNPPMQINNPQPQPSTPPTIPPYQGNGQDVIYVLDTSTSVAQNFQKPIQLLTALTNSAFKVGNGDRIALIVYSGWERQIQFGFDNKTTNQEVIQAIQNVNAYNGATQTGAALQLANQLTASRRPNAPLKVIVVTDGIDSQDDPTSAANQLRGQGANIIAAAVTQYYNQTNLLKIAGSGSNVYTGQDPNSIVQQIVRRFRR